MTCTACGGAHANCDLLAYDGGRASLPVEEMITQLGNGDVLVESVEEPPPESSTVDWRCEGIG